MPKAIYVNLPVRDLQRSRDFYEDLGFLLNPDFSSDQTAAFVISNAMFVMLHTHESFGRLTNKRIADSHTITEVMVALQVDTKQEVTGLVDRAVAVGGTELRDGQDHGFMVARSFEDPDGHIWEVFWFDVGELL